MRAGGRAGSGDSSDRRACDPLTVPVLVRHHVAAVRLQEGQVVGGEPLFALARHLRVRRRMEEATTAKVLLVQTLDHLREERPTAAAPGQMASTSAR